MKYLTLTKHLIVLAFVALTFSACDKADSIIPDVSLLKDAWMEKVKAVFEEATLSIPENVFMQSGGKNGIHSEKLGYILAELQYLQRVYPGAEW